MSHPGTQVGVDPARRQTISFAKNFPVSRSKQVSGDPEQWHAKALAKPSTQVRRIGVPDPSDGGNDCLGTHLNSPVASSCIPRRVETPEAWLVVSRMHDWLPKVMYLVLIYCFYKPLRRAGDAYPIRREATQKQDRTTKSQVQR